MSVAQAQKVKHKPKWQFDVQKLGYRTPGGTFAGLNDPGSSSAVAASRSWVGIVFDARSQPKENAIQLGFLTVLATFDAASGRLLAHREIPSPYLGFSKLAATAQGNLLLFQSIPAGQRPKGWQTVVELLSPDLRTLHTMRMSSNNKDDHWDMKVSATGSSLLLSHHTSHSIFHELFDPDTMTLRTAWTDDKNVSGISDSYAVSSSYPSLPATAVICLFDAHWRPIEYLHGSVIPLDGTKLLGLGMAEGSFTISTVQGKSLFEQSLAAPGANLFVLPAAVSTDGKKFALVVSANTRHWYLSSREFVYVYEPPDRMPIFMLKVHKVFSFDISPSFSPDGNSLAVVDSGKIKVFSLNAP